MGCADSCDPAKDGVAAPWSCTILDDGSWGSCHGTQIDSTDKSKLHTYWLNGDATYTCTTGMWLKEGGGESGGGTYRCSTENVCDPKQFSISGDWEYLPEFSTPGGVTKSETKKHTTSSSNTHSNTAAFAKSFTQNTKVGVLENSKSITLEGSFTREASESITDTTSHNITIGGKCSRAAWQWVWKGDHPNKSCITTVKPGSANFVAFTNSKSEKPCCAPMHSPCPSNEHNPCKKGAVFLCDDFNADAGCNDSCRQMDETTCADTSPRSISKCPVEF